MRSNEENNGPYPLVILEICLAPNLGGLELYFFRCCQYYASSSHSLISLVSPTTRLARHFDQHKLPYQSFAAPRWHQLPACALRLADLIRAQRVDIVHVHHKQDLLLVALAKRLSGRFTFVHTRQMQLPHAKKDPYHRFIYSAVDLLIAITDQLKEKVLQRIPLPSSRVQRLYYGVLPPPPASEANCSSLSSPPATLPLVTVGMFSRIEPLKGQHTLLAAVARLSQQGHRLACHLFGDVSDSAYYQELQQTIRMHQLESVVFFKGFSTQARTLMPCMDMIVMPSIGETFGLTVVEAMRSGVAVIGSDSGGIPEIITHGVNGLLFAPEDSQQLAERMAYLINHPAEREHLAQAGKEDADQRFDQDQHFKKLTHLFYQYHEALTTQPDR